MVLSGVLELAEHVTHRIDAGALLIVGLNGDPRGLVGVRVAEGFLLRPGVVIPTVQRCQVHWGKLPLADRVDLADREAGALFLLGHGEPQLGQGDAGAHDHVLEHRDFAHELGVLSVGAEAHDALDAGAVVPGAVEEHDLAAGWEVLDVALEVPAGGLALGRLLQGDGARTTGVEVLVEALDGATGYVHQ